MTQLEMVEKLRGMANISFEEAKLTLEHNNWDMLDAVIELEKTGKTVKTTSSYNTDGYTAADDFMGKDGAKLAPYKKVRRVRL
jgi:hypothetical protein